MIVLQVLSALLLATGTLLLLAAALGVVRFPDFYTRLHAAGKGDTLGQALVLTGLILSAGFSFVSIKLAIIMFFIAVLNPTATHALARGAWIVGLRPWTAKAPRSFVQKEGQLTPAERETFYREADEAIERCRREASAEAPGGERHG
ncbi:MAG: monovalent cation/H(+) antiporter subunit G [Planctomycetota bacterium]